MPQLTPEEKLLRAIMHEPEMPDSGQGGLPYREAERLEKEAEKFKINLARGGSEQGTKFPGICFHCKNHFAYRTTTMNDPRIFCHASPKAMEMPLNVVECSDYQKVASLSLGQMTQIAWTVEYRDYLKDGYR